MLKKTKPSEATLFDSPSNMLRGRRLKAYEDAKEWHSQFYELVTSNIDEEVFRPLFKDSCMGRGNASISQLVAIMILKEGNRKSDEEVFCDVDFNMLTRKALRFLPFCAFCGVCGSEFGLSVARLKRLSQSGKLFGSPCCRWLGTKELL